DELPGRLRAVRRRRERASRQTESLGIVLLLGLDAVVVERLGPRLERQPLFLALDQRGHEVAMLRRAPDTFERGVGPRETRGAPREGRERRHRRWPTGRAPAAPPPPAGPAASLGGARCSAETDQRRERDADCESLTERLHWRCL